MNLNFEIERDEGGIARIDIPDLDEVHEIFYALNLILAFHSAETDAYPSSRTPKKYL